MKNCKEIENSLTLYLDNLLSDGDKLELEDHLKSCPYCSKSLEQLKETQKLVRGLEDAEPPPWFKQKVMARVRREAEKKSLVQKWFYPLRIKIPVQIFATVVIAVLAVYVYRAGEDRIKEVIPSSGSALVLEVSRSQKAKTPEANVNKERTGIVKDKDEKAVKYAMSSDIEAPMTKKLKKEMPQEDIGKKETDAVKETPDHFTPDLKASKYAGAPAAKSAESSLAAREKREDGTVGGSVMKQDRALHAQNEIPNARIALYVSDIHAALGNVEKLLTRYGAKNIVRQLSEGKAVLTAEFKIQNIKDLITQLKTIGRTEETNIGAGDSGENMTVVIEIMSQ